jgi:invasion protein IalB
MKSPRLAAGLGLLVVALAAEALGQASSPRLVQPPTPGVPVTPVQSAVPGPDRTTASFGDWTLRCDRRADVTPPQRFCEIGQIIQRAGEAGPRRSSLWAGSRRAILFD